MYAARIASFFFFNLLVLRRVILCTTIAAPFVLGFSLYLSRGDIIPQASAASNEIYLESGGGTYFMSKGKSLLDNRFKSVIRQRYDFSCGSAALATLLTYHYGHPVEELSVLNAMFQVGDQAKIKREGFSMLDMKNYLEAIGYHAEGYRESLDRLSQVGIPAVVLINKNGYSHFVVVQGVTKEKVSVGDPTLGLRVYKRKDFEKMWNGILFVVLDNKKVARAAFNTSEVWAVNGGTPNFRQMLDRGQLSELTVDISFSPNYY